MSGSVKSRQKRKPEPISLEELAGTTGMSGFCSFLTRDSAISVPALDQLATPPAPEPDALVTEAPETPAVTSREAHAPVPTALEADALTSRQAHAPASPAPETFAIETGAPDFRFPRKTRIHEALSIEAGHSLGEQQVYDTMFKIAKPYQGNSRILAIGLRTLAELSRMAYSNCKANVRALVAKRAIDESPEFSYTDGRTYLIYTPPEIMRRRQEAGLTHVIRNRGVAFVDPKTGAPISGASS
jgi:hypothetical protein